MNKTIELTVSSELTYEDLVEDSTISPSYEKMMEDIQKIDTAGTKALPFVDRIIQVGRTAFIQQIGLDFVAPGHGSPLYIGSIYNDGDSYKRHTGLWNLKNIITLYPSWVRLRLAGRKPIAKVNGRSYSFGGNIIGGLKAATVIDIYVGVDFSKQY